jgi:hypothetical protein
MDFSYIKRKGGKAGEKHEVKRKKIDPPNKSPSY